MKRKITEWKRMMMWRNQSLDPRRGPAEVGATVLLSIKRGR
jgi:hypothetical protein